MEIHRHGVNDKVEFVPFQAHAIGERECRDP